MIQKGNGVIEQTVQSLRQQCNLLLDQFEEATKTKVPSMHPMHSWCWKHSAFILNRFACSHGQTSAQRISPTLGQFQSMASSYMQG